MEVFEIKAVLLRSNPVMIRQFTVSGERTLKEVSIIIKTLLEWQTPVAIGFGDSQKTIPSETSLKDAFRDKDRLILSFTEKSPSAQKWMFRLICLGTRDQKEDYPRVIRYRGYNLPEGLETTKDFNRLQKVWSGTGLQFYSLYFHKYPREKYVFSVGKGNLLLKKKFSEAEKTKDPKERLELNYEETIDAGILLSDMTIAELYDAGEKCRIPKPKGLKKNELVSYYSEKIAEPETLAAILDSMTLNQYRALKKLCMDTDTEYKPGAVKEVLELLNLCGYARCFEGWGDYSIERSRQLLVAYEQWMDQTDEKEYLRCALLRSTIVGCVRLYGCLEKNYWKQIAPKITGKTYTDQEFETAWEVVRSETYTDNIGMVTLDSLYCSDMLEREDSRQLLKMQPSWGCYIPRVSEIRQLENGGLKYSVRLGDELERMLKKELGMDKEEAERAHLDIYCSFQYGEDPDAYAEWLVKRTGRGGVRLTNTVKKLFAVLKPNTRQVAFGGYTQNEMERR